MKCSWKKCLCDPPVLCFIGKRNDNMGLTTSYKIDTPDRQLFSLAAHTEGREQTLSLAKSGASQPDTLASLIATEASELVA